MSFFNNGFDPSEPNDDTIDKYYSQMSEELFQILAPLSARIRRLCDEYEPLIGDELVDEILKEQIRNIL